MKVKANSSFLTGLLIITMAISPTFALGEGNRNLLLIDIMFISPVIVLFSKKWYRSDFWLIAFMTTIILFPLLHHPESLRWSTVLYSCMFILTFMAYNRLLHRKTFSAEDYQNILRILIYAYFIVLLIQQFCTLTGLPIFNLGNYNSANPWKLNSLAAEPSHSARIVALLMYSYITVKEIIIGRKYSLNADFKDDRWVWIGFLWTMITMGSATAFLFIVIVLLKFIRFRNLIPLFVLFGLIVILINKFEITAFERTYKTFIATLTLNEETIIKADHSAAMRIVPILISAKMIDLTTWDAWFGHGIDYVSSFMHLKIPGIPESASGGGLFSFALEYGIISAFLFIFFSLKTTITRHDYLTIIFWILLILMNGINIQITWLAILLLFTNKYLLNLSISKK